VVELFLRELRARGVEQVWYCQPSVQPGGLRNEYREGVRLIVPPTFGRGGVLGKIVTRLGYLFFETVLLLRQLKTRPDAILVRDKYWGAVVGLMVARLSGSKLLVWLSYPYPEHEREQAGSVTGLRRLLLRSRSWLGFQLLYRFAMPRAAHCFVQSEEMKRDLLRWGIAAERMTAVPMGIKKATFDAVDPDVVPEEPPVVLHLGSLAAVRKLEILVEAFAIVARRRPDARLQFVGEGDVPEERRDLEQKVRDAGLAGVVEFTGQLPIEEAWRRVALSSVCVSPVRMPLLRVASPTKFVEYLAFAKPTVGNEQPEHTMIAQASRGALTVQWTPQSFADAILWCLDHPDEAREMGRRGRAWVGAHRTYDRLADMVHAKLREVLSRSGTAGNGPDAVASSDRAG
jgi:glycosyltransferase involved in cell wall biosynthesis